MKKLIITGTLTAAAFAAGSTLLADVPEVTGVTMGQDPSRLVTITYTLANAPAVVTLDVQTNDTVNGAWASIGGAAIQNAKGDVWKQVEANGSHTITWRPDLSWPGHKIASGGARAVVTAWALDNTPDYMVVDISKAAKSNTQEYYPSDDFLPGGLLSNDVYRTTALVMRKIMAKDVKWTMGSTTLETAKRKDAREATHPVTLTNNYYIGVFEVTHAQYAQMCGSNATAFVVAADCAMRPVVQVSYNHVRDGGDSANYWPNPPKSDSVLGLLRAKTGLDFDLPSDAQWEFACRAGNGDMKWGDGSPIMNADDDENLRRLGRFSKNGSETAAVGSYAPNSWGLYDMHGNVWEFCLDWYADDNTGLYGAVNEKESDYRMERGGSWSNVSGYCRSAYRNTRAPTKLSDNSGFRVVCTAGLR